MSVNFIGQTFPDNWLWSKYEKQIVESVLKQIEIKFNDQHNLLINGTWFGPHFTVNNEYDKFLKFAESNQIDNLFFLTTVDPAMINRDQIDEIVRIANNPKLYKLGNFDTEYHFNFFAPAIAKHFREYTEEELLLTEPKWVYINYNRKPRTHRVQFVRKLIEHNLLEFGIVTLGKPDRIYDNDETNNLYLTIGEQYESYREWGHWYPDDQYGIPHDVLSLHNMNFWKHHFLNVIGATEFNVWDDIFVSETQFKPIIGLRPFLINGNIRTYKWLEDNGFKHFNQYFDWVDLTNPRTVHDSIIEVLLYLSKLSTNEILMLYNKMLPDLKHNRNRFFEYAKEQEKLTNEILLVR